MNVESLLSRLEGVKKTSHCTWIARCSAHEDKSPSLSVRLTEDGAILLFCFAGCGAADILAAIGLSFGDLYPDRETGMVPRGTKKKPRDPWFAIAALRALADESLVVLLAARMLERGEALAAEDMARLATSRARIERARRAQI